MYEDREPTIDTSDVDRWIGVPTVALRMRYPVSESDLGRWAQAMHNPNPLYYDPDYAATSRFEGLVAPFSFTVAAGDGHGATPAVQGHIEGSHMLFGGDEWWFYGPRVRPGDRLAMDRMLFDYRVTETAFAGPTVFSRGDTTYANQRGELVAKQRSTSIRYLVDEARKRRAFGADEDEPTWSAVELESLEAARLDYYRSFLERGHEPRTWESVTAGDALPTRPIGPHTMATFVTEHRARPTTVWGASVMDDGESSLWDAGWLPEMSRDFDKAALTPAAADGLYSGPSRGHVDPELARRIGMPRGYGYGSTMGGWILDTVENWAGEWARIEHSNVRYKSPALTGDATFVEGTVVETYVDPQTAWRMVAVDVRMRNQRDVELAAGRVELVFDV